MISLRRMATGQWLSSTQKREDGAVEQQGKRSSLNGKCGGRSECWHILCPPEVPRSRRVESFACYCRVLWESHCLIATTQCFRHPRAVCGQSKRPLHVSVVAKNWRHNGGNSYLSVITGREKHSQWVVIGIEPVFSKFLPATTSGSLKLDHAARKSCSSKRNFLDLEM